MATKAKKASSTDILMAQEPLLGQKGCSEEERTPSHQIPTLQRHRGTTQVREDSAPRPVRRSRVTNDFRSGCPGVEPDLTNLQGPHSLSELPFNA